METVKQILRDRTLWWQTPLLFLLLHFTVHWGQLTPLVTVIGFVVAVVVGIVLLLLNRKYRREFEECRKRVTGEK